MTETIPSRPHRPAACRHPGTDYRIPGGHFWRRRVSGRHGSALMAAILALAVTGCDTAGSDVELGGTADMKAGFGTAFRSNAAFMSGERAYVVELGARFAREVPTTVTFAFNSAELSPEARAVLRRQADWIRQFPEVRFRVYGHTDKVGPEAYNRRLGRRRAEAVVNFLVSQGIGRDRLEALVSYGEDRPVVPTEGPEQANRRAVTEVSGFLRRHPTVMNGKYAQVVYREYVASATAPSTLTKSETASNN